jgi:hypothetical protein
MSYNGWKNWATWQINLWIDNEEPMYREKQRFLRRSVNEIDADEAEEFCTQLFQDFTGKARTPDMDSDREMNDVDWQEIAEHLNEERKEYA